MKIISPPAAARGIVSIMPPPSVPGCLSGRRWSSARAILPKFTADIKLLETVLGEDFSDWTAPRDRSGNMVGARAAGQAQAENGFRR
jgi:hypothetical protein